MHFYHRLCYPLISLVAALFLTASCIQPPKYSASVIEVGASAPSTYANVTLGVISTSNTEQSKKYLLDLQKIAESGMSWPLTASTFSNAINGALNSRFAKVVQVNNADDARARGASLLMVFDAKIEVGTVSGDVTSLEILAVFKALDGTEVDRITINASDKVPWPNTGSRYDSVMNGGAAELAQAIDNATKLSGYVESHNLAQARTGQPARANGAQTKEAAFPSEPLNISFKEGPAHPDDVAVIIGNANYGKLGKDVPDVKPAYADAASFKKYAMTTLGIREGNIIDMRDATGAQMNRILGSKDQPQGQLSDWVRNGKSNVYVYYAGHGAPGGSDGNAYIIPSDADSSRIEINGYPLKTLYGNLSLLPAKSVTVVLEACFSGSSQSGAVISNASPVFLKAKTPIIPTNITVISAGASDQMASWEQDGSNGLFTKYYLKGLSGEADEKPIGNGDGKVTDAEIGAYLKETLSYYARRYYGRDQTVQIVVGR